jgi:hypothetical protein
VGEFVFLDEAPDRRRHRGVLMVSKINRRHALERFYINKLLIRTHSPQTRRITAKSAGMASRLGGWQFRSCATCAIELLLAVQLGTLEVGAVRGRCARRPSPVWPFADWRRAGRNLRAARLTGSHDQGQMGAGGVRDQASPPSENCNANAQQRPRSPGDSAKWQHRMTCDDPCRNAEEPQSPSPSGSVAKTYGGHLPTLLKGPLSCQPAAKESLNPPKRSRLLGSALG